VLSLVARGTRSPSDDRFKGTDDDSQDDAVRVHQAYRFALDPTSIQERALRSHAGASRFAWNWGLAKCQERYAAEGPVIDRDVNAARNLLKLAASGAERINACGGTVRSGVAGSVPAKQEPGTAFAGETGAASGQPLAARRELTHAY
jgi:helix-turn-helix protein